MHPRFLSAQPILQITMLLRRISFPSVVEEVAAISQLAKLLTFLPVLHTLRLSLSKAKDKLRYKTRKWIITSKGVQIESKKSHPIKVAWYLRQIAVDTFVEVSLAVKETKLVVSRPGRSGIIGSWTALAFFSDTGPPNLLFPCQPKRKLTPVPSLRRALREVRRRWGDLYLFIHPFFCS